MDELNIENITTRAVSGVLALISRNFILNLISAAASLIVFTSLATSDIGIYTIAISAQNLISFFTDFGLGAALVQKKVALTDKDLQTTFTIQSVITLFVFFVVFLLLHPLSVYVKLSDAGSYLLLSLVFLIFISSFKLIPSILLERNLQFHKLVIPHIVESFVFNSILIILVLNHFGITSYTIAFLVSGLIGIPVYYFVSPWKIAFGIDKNSLHHLKFGTQFQAKNILAAIKDNLLIVILPHFLSLREIGYIGFGQRIAFMPYRYVVDSATKVLFSAYARMQEDKTVLKKAIEKSLFFVSSVIFPAMIILIIASSDIIRYFPHWADKYSLAVVSLVFFSLNALISSLSSILVNVLDANGKVKTTLQLMVIWTFLTWGLTLYLIKVYGFNGVAIASFLVTLTIVYTIYLVKKIVSFDFFKSIYKPAIATTLQGFFLFVGLFLFVHNLFELLLVVCLSGLLYLSCMYVISEKQLRTDIQMLLKKP